MDKTLIIINNKDTYNVALLNDEVILPSEAYSSNSQVIEIGVFGKSDNVILSTPLISIWMTKGSYIDGKEPANLPTPTQWDLYIKEINSLLKSCQLSEEECKNTLSEIEDVKNSTESYMKEIKKSKRTTSK